MESRSNRFYELRLSTGKLMPIHKDVLSNFISLQTMLQDLPLEAGLPLPVPDFITEPILKWIIDAYILYEAKGFGLSSFDALYDNIAIYNDINALTRPDASPPFLTLFGEGQEPVRDDLALLASLIEALNWLDAKFLLLITLDKVDELVRDMRTRDIEAQYTHKKRKQENSESACKIDLPLTPYYMRERIIYDFLVHLIPHELVPSIPLALERHINPIQCGLNHQLFLKSDGVYGVGDNSMHQLALEEEGVHRIRKLTGPPGRALLIGCSNYESFCLTTTGLYHTGTAILDINTRTEHPKWELMSVDGEVLSITACHDRVMVVTTRGLFVSGQNRAGLLAVGDYEPRSVLTKSIMSGTVLSIACGVRHTIVLTRNGLYGIGANEYGELGSAPNNNSRSLYTRIAGVQGEILSIAAGDHHTMIITTMGLFATGLALNGQLGLGDDKASKYKLTLVTNIEGTPRAVYACVFYTLLLTSTGLYSTGTNMLALSTTFVKVFDTGLEDISTITCTKTEIFLLTDQGNVYLAGSPRSLPTVEIDMDAQDGDDERYFTVFTKLAINMNYLNSCLTFNDDETEPERKQIKRHCTQCDGEARFMSSPENLPFCSKLHILPTSIEEEK